MELHFKVNQPCCMIDSNAANVWTAMLRFIRIYDHELKRLREHFRVEGDMIYLGQSPVGIKDDTAGGNPHQSCTHDAVCYKTNESLTKMQIFSAIGVVNRCYADVYNVETTPIGFAHYTAE